MAHPSPDEHTPEDLIAISSLRSHLPADLTPAQSSFCTDLSLRRFLRARDHHEVQALEMLLASLEWREAWAPDQIDAAEMKDDLAMGKMYMQGFDRSQRPVVIIRPGNDLENHATNEDKIRYYVFMLEYAIKKMPPGVELMTWLVDLNGYSVGASDLKKLSLAQALVTTMQDNYPERVGKIILVHPPWYFRLLFNLLRPVVSQKTLDKIVFSYPKKKANTTTYPEMLEYIDPQNLEVRYGGVIETPTNFDYFCS